MKKNIEIVLLIYEYGRWENISIIMAYRIGSMTEMAFHVTIIFYFILYNIAIP